MKPTSALLLLLLVLVNGQDTSTFDKPCQVADASVLLAWTKCMHAAHAQIHANNVILKSPNDANFVKFIGNKATLMIWTWRIHLELEHINFPELTYLSGYPYFSYMKSLKYISFPKLETIEKGGLEIRGNPNLLEINIKEGAVIKNYMRVLYNAKLTQQQLTPLSNLPAAKTLQEEGNCDFSTQTIQSMAELKGCKRLSGRLSIAEDVADVDFPLPQLTELVGCLNFDNTKLGTLNIQISGCGAQFDFPEGAVTLAHSVNNNKYFCEDYVDDSFGTGNCAAGCKDMDKFKEADSTCTILQTGVSIDSTSEALKLNRLEDFRGSVKIAGTSLTKLDDILGSTEYIYAKTGPALEIVGNTKLTSLAALSQLRVIRSPDAIKVRIRGNGVSFTCAERDSFFNRTGLDASEVDMDPCYTPTKEESQGIIGLFPADMSGEHGQSGSNHIQGRVRKPISLL